MGRRFNRGILLLAVAACSGGSPPITTTMDSGVDPATPDTPSIPLPPETRNIVDPSLPPNVVNGFDSATGLGSGLEIVYPNNGVVIPSDLAAIEVQSTADPSFNAYLVTMASDGGDRLRGFRAQSSWLPDAGDWTWFISRAAGHTVTLTVTGALIDGNGAVENGRTSAPRTFTVSRDRVSGALYYFATTGDQLTGQGTLERLQVGERSPARFVDDTVTGGKCVGCHTLTRDGSKLAMTDFVFTLGADINLRVVRAEDPRASLAGEGIDAAQSAFNPDGSLMVTAYQGRLALRDGNTGASLGEIPTQGAAYYPDWSWDGSKIVFVRTSTPCTAGFIPFGQDSVFVYNGAIVTMDYSNQRFSNEQVVVPEDNNYNNYYPAFSPDGQYIAFSRASKSVRSHWGMADLACAGLGGGGNSYDNPSASVWLLRRSDNQLIELARANGGAMLTNSWPRWGPKADGEYLWLLFSSTRNYGQVLGGSHQLWFAAIPRTAPLSPDPSYPAVWFPFQNQSTKNHVGQWSLKVGDFELF